MTELLKTDFVSYTYHDGLAAISQLSFSLREGEKLALVGANGAGKSTLLLLLCACLLPQDGKIFIDSIELNAKTRDKLRTQIGMVFQNADDQLFLPRVYDDVAFGPLNMNLDKAETNLRVEEALSQVGALHLKNRPTHHLSGGEKKLIALATVLSMYPKLLILDEPNSNLDPRARRNIINLLQGINKTQIIATHDLDLALDLCPRTLILKGGKMLADGKTSELLYNVDLIAEAGLELPLTKKNIAY